MTFERDIYGLSHNWFGEAILQGAEVNDIILLVKIRVGSFNYRFIGQGAL